MRSFRVAAIVAAVVLVVLVALPARANVARSSFDGDRYGTLVARSENVLRVDEEDLVFDLAPDLGSARVTATYRFSNPSAEARKAEAAFVFVQGDAATKLDAAATITVDGAPATFALVNDAMQLRPQLEAWIAAHPDRAADKLDPQSPSAVRVFVEARDAGVQNDDLTMRAAREVIPDAVAAMEKGFSTLGASRRMTWLAFTLEVAPNAAKTVAISYTHVPGQDLAKRVNTTFTYEYLLSPAKTWAAFGPLHVRVRLPPNTLVESAMSWRTEDAERRADFTTLPEGELTFEVMSKKNLWLGMTAPGGYWGILLGVLLAIAILAGRAGGKMWAKGGTTGIASVGWIAAIAIVSGLAATFIAVLLTALFPERALGFGYGPIFGLFVAALGVSVAAPIVAATRRSRMLRS